MGDTVIAARPPDDGREWEVQCARCGSSVMNDACSGCDGDGFVYDDEDDDAECVRCNDCDGGGSWALCMSDAAWCEAHPLPEREQTERGALEWFVAEREVSRG